MADGQQSTVDFNKLANLDVGDIEEPKPLPQGTYNVEIVGEPAWHTAKTGTPGIKFVLALKEAGEDVDEEELQVYGGLVNTQGQARQMNKVFYYQANSGNFGWDFRQLCDSFGMEGAIGDMLPKFAGQEAVISVKHKNSNRGRPMAEIDTFIAREE